MKGCPPTGAQEMCRGALLFSIPSMGSCGCPWRASWLDRWGGGKFWAWTWPPLYPGGGRCASLLCKGVNEQRPGPPCRKGTRVCYSPSWSSSRAFSKSSRESVLWKGSQNPKKGCHSTNKPATGQQVVAAVGHPADHLFPEEIVTQ